MKNYLILAAIFGILLLAIAGLGYAKMGTNNAVVSKMTTDCELIYGTGGSNNINIYFFGANYSNANDLRSDIDRILYSTSESQGLGFLTIEPFKSNLNKMNIYFVKGNISLNGTDSCYQAEDMIKKRCSNYVQDSMHFIHIILNVSGSFDGSYGDGDGICSRSVRYTYGKSDLTDSVSLFEHEMGHNFGLTDEYMDAYYLTGTGDYNSFIRSQSANCDPNPGCPKWCKGKPVTHFANPCENYTTDTICKSHSADKNCIWVKIKDPYFNANCIKNDDYHSDYTKSHNIGTQCIAGTGCYWGCDGNGYRSLPINNFVYVSTYKEMVRTDSQGKKHMYGPIAENYIKDKYFKTLIKGPSPIQIGAPLS